MTAIESLPSQHELDRAASLLATSPDYRVLRRFLAPRRYREDPPHAGLALSHGMYVDVETTGLDVEQDRIIELAVVPFSFDEDGQIYEVMRGWSQFEDPGIPIPPEITELTGIVARDVMGCRLSDDLLIETVKSVELVVAHNADFDRKMLERRLPIFARVDWACSYREVPWQAMGVLGAKLPHILAEACGGFYDAHRALDDCLVGVHVLATAQHEGKSAFAHLLESSRRPLYRVWATNSWFRAKDKLKARGYRWAPDPVKCWFKDLALEADVGAESAWLCEHAGVVKARVELLRARDRYSVRAQ